MPQTFEVRSDAGRLDAGEKSVPCLVRVGERADGGGIPATKPHSLG